MDIRIVPNAGHYDVYIDGDFYCSADSYSEARDEVKRLLKKYQIED
jgi:hypothetical protein